MNTSRKITFYEIHSKASEAAWAAAQKYLVTYLDGRDSLMCGFAWVEVKVRSNSTLGKDMITEGFRKPYGTTGKLSLWNPSKMGVQNIDTLYAGAEAYANVLREHGIDAYAYSCLD